MDTCTRRAVYRATEGYFLACGEEQEKIMVWGIHCF
jgi:hypothetical protein